MRVEIKIPLREDIKDPQSEVILDVLNRYLNEKTIQKIDVSKTYQYKTEDTENTKKYFEKIKEMCINEGLASPNINDIKIAISIESKTIEKTFLGQYNFKKSIKIKR